MFCRHLVSVGVSAVCVARVSAFCSSSAQSCFLLPGVWVPMLGTVVAFVGVVVFCWRVGTMGVYEF